MKSKVLNPNKQKNRLRWILLFFFMAPSIPVFLLLQTVYSKLGNEAYFTARHQAETLVEQIDLKLQQILEKEQTRPIAEYQFFNVMENPLLSETAGVKFSPLSEIPPKSDIDGLVGYFQINTDGSFHLPSLPELGQDNISGLSLAELENRLKLKHKIRNLLSISESKNRPVRVEHLNQSFGRSKNVSVGENQPYIKEFKQQNTSITDDFSSSISSPESVAKAKKTTSGIYNNTSLQSKAKPQQQFDNLAKKYPTRKEMVQLPDQSMASSYFKRSRKLQKPVQSEQENQDFAKNETIMKRNQTSNSEISVFSFESEVTPLQLLIIGREYFCFYRYIWHDKNRYTQGFIVKVDAFIANITQGLISSTNFSRLLFSSNKDLLLELEISPTQYEYSLYSRNLAMPFQKLRLIVNAAKITNIPGALLIDLLALSIYCIFIFGFIAFYRLGCRQIDLANQQQNFISAVGHELKTPLTSIRMYGEMLRSGWAMDENKKKKYYDFIFYESERLSRLINNVLKLASLGHQTQAKPKIITTSAHDLLKQVSSRVESQIEASSFKFNIVPLVKNSEQIKIKIDEDAFFQIVINLVDNAIKFSTNSNNKQIDIGFVLSKNKKTISFIVRDYGPGIKKNQMKKIFQLFYRSEDELTRTTPGTGIGLALVAQLAESMGATITVANKQPGAEFQIKLAIA